MTGKIITPFSETSRNDSPHFGNVVVNGKMTVMSYSVDGNQMFQSGDQRLETAVVMVKVKQFLYGPG